MIGLPPRTRVKGMGRQQQQQLLYGDDIHELINVDDIHKLINSDEIYELINGGDMSL